MKKKGLLLTGGLVLVAVTLTVGSYVFNDKVEEAAIEATEGKPASDSEKNADVGEVALTDEVKAAVAEEEQGNAGSVFDRNNIATAPVFSQTLRGNSSSIGLQYAGVPLFNQLTNYDPVSGQPNQSGFVYQPVSSTPSSGGANNTTQTNNNPSQGSGVTNGGNTSSNNGSTGSTGGGNNQPPSTSEPSESESVTAIKNRYFPKFQQLEWEHNGQLESLVQQAFDEYMDSGSGSFNSNKYKSQARALESSADAAFYATYNQLQSELTQNGHSKNAASEFEQSYHSKKAARESELQGLVGNF
ncbi:hypothetical protein [Alkalihalophilus marmarensis]|uniref:hypothetical protein n=1 Tax=Alkalihalophilus marmarensis TaxID=521377 RepID=UPI002DBFC5C8|nr:hypothetical protein [Alkalihalophilus marmarensis]MEC2071356.1 hypothetical protein [Alkalihalophilus marmarensis]